jgi:molybdate transport system substrate-binding protein
MAVYNGMLNTTNRERAAFMKPFRHPAKLLAAWIVALVQVGAAHADTPRQPEILVFAAASLTNVLGDLSANWQKTSGVTVKLSFAASSVLARQIEAGGRADVFISADQEWMDYLQSRGLIEKPTRRNLVGNRLVLIAPADSSIKIKIAPGFPLVGALAGGRLATGDPDTVPVGRYARSALISLGVWDQIQEHLVRADNVRGAMTFVERGEVPLGIVYATDAMEDPKVRIVDTFPANTHAPVTYPAAVVNGAHSEARIFVEFLGGAGARDAWTKYGFVELRK